MNKIIILLIFELIFTQIPIKYNLLNNTPQLNRYEDNSIKGQIVDNYVIDIRSMNDSIYFFGTASGLSYGIIGNENLIDFGYFTIPELPRGGNPSVVVRGNVIAVSGVIDTSVVTGSEAKGTGVAYSNDKGETCPSWRCKFTKRWESGTRLATTTTKHDLPF